MATIKVREAFKKVVKGSSLTSAMKDVGYSVETSKRTNKLTNTKGWKELLDKSISDKKLIKVLDEGLSAGKMVNEELEADYAVRHKYLETGLKLKSRFPKEDSPIFPIQINFNDARSEFL